MPKVQKRTERYELERSPFAQNPTQKELGQLVGLKRDALRALATHRDLWIVRRDEPINGKLRHLAYPRGKLRAVHERFKFHLKKIKQPEYLFSPRTGRSQRDNAARHIGQQQFFSLDIKQFYPSTTEKHVFHWAVSELGMRKDVAGLFTRIVTVDGIVSFGSPLTPVLATLVHRRMFDTIAKACKRRGLQISLWVDDITISGNFVPGELVSEIREIIRSYGLRSHKLNYRTGNRPVSITGVDVNGNELCASRLVHERVRKLYVELSSAKSDLEADLIIGRLLSALGTLRYTIGRKSAAGRRVSDRMNSLRQKRFNLNPITVSVTENTYSPETHTTNDLPWN